MLMIIIVLFVVVMAIFVIKDMQNARSSKGRRKKDAEKGHTKQ